MSNYYIKGNKQRIILLISTLLVITASIAQTHNSPIIGETIYRDVNQLAIVKNIYNGTDTLICNFPCRIYIESSSNSSSYGLTVGGMVFVESNTPYVKVKVINSKTNKKIYSHKFKNCFLFMNEKGAITVCNGLLCYIELYIQNKIVETPFLKN